MSKTGSIHFGRAVLAAALVLAGGGMASASPTVSLHADLDLLHGVVASIVHLVVAPASVDVESSSTVPKPTPTEEPDPTADLPSDDASGHEGIWLGDQRTGGGNGDDGAGPWPFG